MEYLYSQLAFTAPAVSEQAMPPLFDLPVEEGLNLNYEFREGNYRLLPEPPLALDVGQVTLDTWRIRRTGGQSCQLDLDESWHWSTYALPPGRCEAAPLRRLSRFYRHPWILSVSVRRMPLEDAEISLLENMHCQLKQMTTEFTWTAQQREMLQRVIRRQEQSSQHLKSAELVIEITVRSPLRLPDHFGKELVQALTGQPNALLATRAEHADSETDGFQPRDTLVPAEGLWILQHRYTRLEAERLIPPVA